MSLEELRHRVRTCSSCHIIEEADNKPTPSSGPPSKVMLIGRNPGIQERDGGVPFIGRTKGFIDDFIGALGYDRETIYITNVVKCYTKNPKPDRPPTPQEVKFCSEIHLEAELAMVKPEVVVAFGKDALVYLSGGLIKTCVGMNGTVIPIPGRPFKVFSMYHPAMALYDPKKYTPIFERDYLVLYSLLKANGLLGPHIENIGKV